MNSETLEKLKQVELEILVDIDKFCMTNNIEYSICAGTALGAVRHGGFIPWDDDIDIMMERTEFERFREIWNKNPINGYYFENYIDDSLCDICHGKIRKDETTFISEGVYSADKHNGIWIDIFPLDRITTENEKWIKKIGKRIILLSRANAIYNRDSVKNKLVKRLFRLIPSRIRKNKLKKYYYKLLETDNATKNNYSLISMSTILSMSCIYPKKIFDDNTEIEFEDHMLKITWYYDEYLRLLYGDYMKLPPTEQRKCTHNPVKIDFGEGISS